jgi:predicted regulator of Ras-like GTPase activity (Roadblock/LC7/MglB family)
MFSGDFGLLAEDAERLTAILRQLCESTRGRAAFLVDRHGRLLAGEGKEADLDTTSLASLVAGSIAATGSLAQLLGERGFNGLFHEGEHTHLYLALVERGPILVVVFDGRSSLGLVRFRVKRASEEIGEVLAAIAARTRGGKSLGPAAAGKELAEITDEDIENLLSN